MQEVSFEKATYFMELQYFNCEQLSHWLNWMNVVQFHQLVKPNPAPIPWNSHDKSNHNTKLLVFLF